MGLINGIVSAHLNKSILIQVDDIYLLSIEKSHDFGLVGHEAARDHSGKQYTHVGYWVISMKYIYINDVSRVKVLYPEDYEVDNAEHKVPLGIITK